MDKVTFVKRVLIWTTVITAAIIAVIGLCFGSVIEGSLGEEVWKWIVMGGVVIVIVDILAYLVALPLCHHINLGKGEKR